MKVLQFAALYLVALIAGVSVIIAGGLLYESMVEHGFTAVFTLTSRVGWLVLVAAIMVFVADMTAMAIYTIRFGESDGTAGRIVSGRRTLPLSPGARPSIARSKIRSLGDRHRYITMRSLVDGTATPAERMMVAGIITAVGSFFCIFLGLALIFAANNPVGLAFAIVPALWAGKFARTTWRSYQRVKAGLPEEEEASP
jgi:hypothetical protein